MNNIRKEQKSNRLIYSIILLLIFNLVSITFTFQVSISSSSISKSLPSSTSSWGNRNINESKTMLNNNNKKFSLSDLFSSSKSNIKPFFAKDNDNVSANNKKEDVIKKTNEILNEVVNQSTDKVLVSRSYPLFIWKIHL